MSGGFSFDGGDHVHSSAMENTRPVATVPFHYPADEPEPEPAVPLDVATSALSEIVNWSCDGQDPSMCAARIFSIQTMLNPVHARYKSLAQIANACNISRASISKSLLIFRDSHSVKMSVGRLQSSRGIYAEAQKLSVTEGRHFSCLKKTVPSGDHMSPKEIRERYNTLDKARTRIEELEVQIESQTKKQNQLSTMEPPLSCLCRLSLHFRPNSSSNK